MTILRLGQLPTGRAQTQGAEASEPVKFGPTVPDDIYSPCLICSFLVFGGSKNPYLGKSKNVQNWPIFKILAGTARRARSDGMLILCLPVCASVCVCVR